MSGNLFYGVDLSTEICDKVMDLVGIVQRAVPRAACPTKDKLHITLQFLGKVPPMNSIDRLTRLSRLGPGEVRVKGAGVFVNGNGPRVLFLKLQDGGFLDGLSYDLGRRGLFNAHLTLAKLEDKGDAEHGFYRLEAQLNSIDLGECQIDKVHLYETVGNGAPYKVLASQVLHGPRHPGPL